MSNLENLVPSRDLCRKIPNGHFADSALVWWGMCVYPRIHPDGARYGEPYRRPGSFPAPTLAEILLALSESGNAYTSKNEVGCAVFHEIPGDEEGYGYSMRTETDKDNYAAAALKLWLELNKEGEQ